MSEDKLPTSIFDDIENDDFYLRNQYYQYDFNDFFDTKLNSNDDPFLNHCSPNFDISEHSSSLYTTNSASDMKQSTNPSILSNSMIDSTNILSIPKINKEQHFKNMKSKKIVELAPEGRKFKNSLSLELVNDPKKTIDKRIIKQLHDTCCNYNKKIKPCTRTQFRSFGNYYNEHSSEVFEIITTLRTLRDHGIITYPESN